MLAVVPSHESGLCGRGGWAAVEASPWLTDSGDFTACDFSFGGQYLRANGKILPHAQTFCVGATSVHRDKSELGIPGGFWG